jgi:hypothetical protein
MVIGTAVFQRIFFELKESATNAVAETMAETPRFGSFKPDHIRECAKERLQKHINQYQSAIPA